MKIIRYWKLSLDTMDEKHHCRSFSLPEMAVGHVYLLFTIEKNQNNCTFHHEQYL